MTTFDENLVISSNQFSNNAKRKLLQFKFVLEKINYYSLRHGTVGAIKNVEVKFYGSYIHYVRLGGYIVKQSRASAIFLASSNYLTWFEGRIASADVAQRLLDLAHDLKNGKFEQKKYMNQEKVA
jgi:hypothetical protein